MASLAGKHLSMRRRCERTQGEKYALFHNILCSVMPGICFFNFCFWNIFCLQIYYEKRDTKAEAIEFLCGDCSPLLPYLCFIVFCIILSRLTAKLKNSFLPRIAAVLVPTACGIVLTKIGAEYFLLGDCTSVPVFILYEVSILFWLILAYAVGCSDGFSAYFLPCSEWYYIFPFNFGGNKRFSRVAMIPAAALFVGGILHDMLDISKRTERREDIGMYLVIAAFFLLFSIFGKVFHINVDDPFNSRVQK